MQQEASSPPVRRLGNVVPVNDAVPQGSPPTSYAAYAVLDGEQGAVLRFLGLTLLRALLIAPGVALTGVRGKQLIYGSLAGSAIISAGALGYVWVCKRNSEAEPVGPLPTTDMPPPAPPPDSGVVDTTAEPVSA